MQAWKAGADCVVLEMHELRRYLGISKIREARIDWICEDVAEWFPYSEKFYFQPDSLDNSLTELWLSRRPLEGIVSLARMTIEQRIKNMPGEGPVTVMLNDLVSTGVKWTPSGLAEHIRQMVPEA